MDKPEDHCGELKPKKETIDDKLKQPAMKQWLPFVGLYFVLRDCNKDKPSLMDSPFKHPVRYFGSATYHALIYGYSVKLILERIL
ncbi:hypothetical protein ACFL0E_00575 [Nanoarchaeota archaeon]